MTFLDAVGMADWSEPDAARATAAATMLEYLPTDELRFLMELSIDPIAAQLSVR